MVTVELLGYCKTEGQLWDQAWLWDFSMITGDLVNLEYFHRGDSAATQLATLRGQQEGGVLTEKP